MLLVGISVSDFSGLAHVIFQVLRHEAIVVM